MSCDEKGKANEVGVSFGEKAIFILPGAVQRHARLTALARRKRSWRKSEPVQRFAVSIGVPYHGRREDPEICIHCGRRVQTVVERVRTIDNVRGCWVASPRLFTRAVT